MFYYDSTVFRKEVKWERDGDGTGKDPQAWIRTQD